MFQRIHDIRERINARTIVEDLHAPQHTDFGEHVDEPGVHMRCDVILFFILKFGLNRHPQFGDMRLNCEDDAGVRHYQTQPGRGRFASGTIYK